MRYVQEESREEEEEDLFHQPLTSAALPRAVPVMAEVLHIPMALGGFVHSKLVRDDSGLVPEEEGEEEDRLAHSRKVSRFSPFLLLLSHWPIVLGKT